MSVGYDRKNRCLITYLLELAPTVMHLYPVDELRLKHGHHTISAHNPTETPSPAKSPDFSKPLSRVDRGSAIALGILLFLILVAMGWFCNVRIQQKKETNAEQRLSGQANTITENNRSPGGGISQFSLDKPFFIGFPSRSRADSGLSTLVGSESANRWLENSENSENKEKRKHSWPEKTPQASTQSPTKPPYSAAGTLPVLEDHRRTYNRTRSLSAPSQTTPRRDRIFDSPTQRHASYHRRRNSVRSIDTYIPTRQASLSQTQHDKWWWSEAGSHGRCSARTHRRISTLAPIFEAEAALQAECFGDVQICGCDGQNGAHTVGRH